MPHLNQWTDHSDRVSIRKTLTLNETSDQINLIDLYEYSITHPVQRNTHFSKVHMGHFQDRSHVRSQSSPNTIKEIKTILSIFSDHNKMKLEINYRKSGKITYM